MESLFPLFLPDVGPEQVRHCRFGQGGAVFQRQSGQHFLRLAVAQAEVLPLKTKSQLSEQQDFEGGVQKGGELARRRRKGRMMRWRIVMDNSWLRVKRRKSEAAGCRLRPEFPIVCADKGVVKRKITMKIFIYSKKSLL